MGTDTCGEGSAPSAISAGIIFCLVTKGGFVIKMCSVDVLAFVCCLQDMLDFMREVELLKKVRIPYRQQHCKVAEHCSGCAVASLTPC